MVAWHRQALRLHHTYGEFSCTLSIRCTCLQGNAQQPGKVGVHLKMPLEVPPRFGHANESRPCRRLLFCARCHSSMFPA